MTVRAIVPGPLSTWTESRTLHGATPPYQLIFTRTWRPSTEAWSTVGATGWGFCRPGSGTTRAGCPAPGSTGVGSTGSGRSEALPVPGLPASRRPPRAVGRIGRHAAGPWNRSATTRARGRCAVRPAEGVARAGRGPGRRSRPGADGPVGRGLGMPARRLDAARGSARRSGVRRPRPACRPAAGWAASHASISGSLPSR